MRGLQVSRWWCACCWDQAPRDAVSWTRMDHIVFCPECNVTCRPRAEAGKSVNCTKAALVTRLSPTYAGPLEHAGELLGALKQALEDTEDGLHTSPCGDPNCWAERAERAIARAEGRLP